MEEWPRHPSTPVSRTQDKGWRTLSHVIQVHAFQFPLHVVGADESRVPKFQSPLIGSVVSIDYREVWAPMSEELFQSPLTGSASFNYRQEATSLLWIKWLEIIALQLLVKVSIFYG